MIFNPGFILMMKKNIAQVKRLGIEILSWQNPWPGLAARVHLADIKPPTSEMTVGFFVSRPHLCFFLWAELGGEP